MPGALRPDGRPGRLRPANAPSSELVRRHESLRTCFPTSNGQPSQRILEPASFALPEVDLSSRGDREAEVRRLAGEDAHAPFALDRGPLLRASLLRLGAHEHVLLLNMHHIVSDGWSMGVLVREVAALYEAFCAGRPSPLPELPVQYADYSVWQRSWLQGEALEAQLSWWRKHLEGAPVLELPTDRPRPAVRTYRGAMQAVTLPRELSASLHALARREGVTPFMLLLTAFQVLLARYSGQEDISVGSPIAGRRMAELEGLIGFFINTLVVRTRLSRDASFRAVLARVKETTLGAFAHQDIPFEKLVEELAPERSLGHSPLFQVMFALQNIPAGELQLPGITLRQERQEGTTTKFDLSLSLAEGPDGFGGGLAYNTDLFDAATAARMMRHFQVLLEAIAARPDTALGALPLLTPEEHQQVLFDWSGPAAGFPRDVSLHRLIEQQAARTPGAPAVRCEDAELSYRQLDARANQLAHHLRALGVGPDVPVALCLERGVDLVVALLGVLKAGGAYVPLEPSQPPARLRTLVAEVAAPVVVTESRHGASFEASSVRRVLLDVDAEQLARHRTEAPECAVLPENLAYVLFTSGSTGRPKGVAVSHGQLVNYVHAATERLRLTECASFALVSTFGADLGNTVLFPALCTGALLHVLTQERAGSPEGVAEYFQRHAVDCVKIVPSHLAALLTAARPRHVLPRKRLVLGGESSTWALLEQVRALAPECEVFNHYGPTETTVGVLAGRMESPPAALASVPLGWALANTRPYVLDGGLRPLPPGVPGELYIGGTQVTRGYLGRPELTAERYVPDPYSPSPGARMYRTGDRVRWLADGRVEFLGRADFQVKVRGFRVEPGEIAAVLREHPSVREAVVVALEVAGDTRLVAYVTASPGQTPDTGVLRAFIQERLPAHMVPTAFGVLDALPLTPNGKVDRKALPPPDGTPSHADAQAFVPPRDALELEVAHAFEAVLDVRPIGARGHFFELGGHSLLACGWLAVLAARTHRRLPLSVLFLAPTVERLAAALRTEAGPWSPLVPIQREGSRRPFFCVHPVGGNVLAYAELARRLGPEQPFYGLQSQGLDGAQPPLESVEEMAAYYIEAIRTVQPHGPYLLGGWSMGGVVAFEMTRQLQRRGERVEVLALIDPSPTREARDATGEDAAPDTVALFARDLGRLTGLPLPELSGEAGPEELLQAVLEEGRRHGVLIPEAGLPELRTLLQVFSANVRALRGYSPRPIDARLAVLRAADSVDASAGRLDRGWGDQSTQGVEIQEVPGDHYGLLQPPHVQVLAERLKALLERAEATDSGSGVQQAG
ncbi:non-ribosomal peptide synthetase [Pyxidicoccus sp. 3LFB2]